MPRKTESERRFERYLNARGHTFEFEPELGTSLRPDYRVLVGARTVICEVKEFNTNWISRRVSAIGSADPRQPTRAVRKRVFRAAEQLAELADRDLPLVIVLSNPNQADVDLAPERVWAMLYHDNGPLENNGADHVSAVVILHRRLAVEDWAAENVRRLGPISALIAAARADDEGTAPEGETLYVTVLPTTSQTAVAVPDALFNGPEDSVWEPA